MGPGNALHDGQTETDPGLVGTDAFGTALEPLGEGGHPGRREPFAGVLDHQGGRRRILGRTDPHHALIGPVVDDRIVNEVRGLSQRAAEYGLCQIYANESWHYELRPEAVDRGCPPLYPDPTADPRMQQ